MQEDSMDTDVRPVLDRGVLDRLVDSLGATGPSLIDELIIELGDDVPVQFTTLEQALEHGDAVTVRRVAHTLKSTAALFGGMRLSSVMRTIEAMAVEGRLVEIPFLMRSAREEYAAFSALLGQWKAS